MTDLTYIRSMEAARAASVAAAAEGGSAGLLGLYLTTKTEPVSYEVFEVPKPIHVHSECPTD